MCECVPVSASICCRKTTVRIPEPRFTSNCELSHMGTGKAGTLEARAFYTGSGDQTQVIRLVLLALLMAELSLPSPNSGFLKAKDSPNIVMVLASSVYSTQARESLRKREPPLRK